MDTIYIKKKAEKKFKQKYPLIHKEDLMDADQQIIQKGWVKFVSESSNFLGYGYLGKQHKGYGWLISFKENQPITKGFIINLVKGAIKKRQAFFKKSQTNAFRVFNGEGDGFGGMTVDWYKGYLVMSWYNKTIYEKRGLFIDIFKQELNDVKGIYEKVRFQDEHLSESSFIWGKEADNPLIIKENGACYATYLNEGLMTGIFLDQTDVREELIKGLACDKSVLNTFSYTGAFSIASVIGGAKETTSVDLAKRSVEKTREQFIANGIDPEKQRIIVMDVFKYLNYAKKKKITYDLVILDPPSFARNKKKTFSVTKDYSKLTKEAVDVINSKGILIASTNAANLSPEKFAKMVEKGISEANRTGKLIKTYRLPIDFCVSPFFLESNYLKVLIYKLD